MGAGGNDVAMGLLGLRQAAAEQNLGLQGIHIAQDDHPPVTFRWVSDDRRDVYSVSKTFTSVAIGIAKAEGLLELDDRVLDHLPQFADTAAAGVEDVTIRHLLAMTAGIDYRWDDPDIDHDAQPNDGNRPRPTRQPDLRPALLELCA